jgi:hypothetical protein
MADLRETLSRFIDLLQISEEKKMVTPDEAEFRAIEFLRACSYVAHMRHLFSNQHVGAVAEQSTAYKLAIIRAEGKNITERKVIAEADPEYVLATKKAAELQNDIDFLRQHYDIFNNAHILYRQIYSQIQKEIRSNGI